MTDERRGPEPISKQTGAYLSVGVIITAITAATFAGVKWNAAEARATALAVELADTSDRQQTYIERRNGQHDDMQEKLDELHERIETLVRWISRSHGEDPTR